MIESLTSTFYNCLKAIVAIFTNGGSSVWAGQPSLAFISSQPKQPRHFDTGRLR